MRKHEDNQNIIDDILSNCQIRRTKKQKKTFIDYLCKRLGNAGYVIDNDSVKTHGKGVFQSNNLVIGNPETAKVVLTAHYDTCVWGLIPNIMMPMNPLMAFIKSIALSSPLLLMALSALLAILFIIALTVALLGIRIVNSEEIIWFAIGLMVICVLCIFFGGFPNKHTANDNTSGVILLTNFLEKLPERHRKDVCVVFFDNEEKGLLGSWIFNKKNRAEMDKKLLLNFDCIGDGDHVVSLAKEICSSLTEYSKWVESLKEAGKENNFKVICEENNKHRINSDQRNFKNGVGVCSLSLFKGIYYTGRIHTPWDVNCMERNIEVLQDALLKFVSKLS